MTPTAPALPRALRWAVNLLLAEAAAIAVVVVYLAVRAVGDDGATVRGGLAVVGYAVVIGAALAGLALALARRKPRARAPAIVLQLLAVMVALVLVSSGQVWLGLPLALSGVVVTTLLLAPATTAALT